MWAAWYSWRASVRRTWRSALVVGLLCAVLGAVALAALAGARRTESAYGRYLHAINSSDVFVNVPSPDTSLIARVAGLPGIRSSAAWLGLDANPVVHGRVDYSFVTNGFAGSQNGDLFTQDTMTVVAGHLPRLSSTDQIVLTPTVARLFGVGVGGRVTYQFVNALTYSDAATGYRTYTVAAIVDLPPALVDQFDQVASAVLPPGATVAAQHLPGAVAFSWVGVRLDGGSAAESRFSAEVSRLAAQVGNGYTFAIRRLDTVHAQVQEAIRPQAVAVAIFGGFALLALLVLVGQALAQLLERTGAEAAALRAMGLTRAETAAACGLGGALAVIVGLAFAVAGAVVLSDLAPVGPVRSLDPVRGMQFDATVLGGGGALLLVLLLALVAALAWRSVRPIGHVAGPTHSVVTRSVASTGLPATVALGAGYSFEASPGRARLAARSTVIGSVVAVAAVVMAAVFGASLNGLVTHPDRYGWNWQVLIQNQGGYGSFLPEDVNASTLGDGEGVLDSFMSRQPGVRAWSSFAFTQLDIDGRNVPVLGLATHDPEGRPAVAVEPPTVSGTALTHTAPAAIGSSAGPNEIELGVSTLHQLDVTIGQTVAVSTGPGARIRHLRLVGVVTLPSIGVMLSDHVSLGRGAMLPETTLLSIEDLAALNAAPAEAFSALPSAAAIDFVPGASAAAFVRDIVRADPGGVPGGIYQVHRDLGAAIVDASQMGSQPVALALALAAAVIISLSATVVVATRRRRRELAVLRALGLTRRQMRSIIVSQTVSLLLVAMVIGLPLGIAGGHWAWSSFATSLGVVPVIVTPVVALALGVVGVLVAGVLAALPAMVAARTATATTIALRSE